MNDEYLEKTIRLLDIIYGLYGADKHYPDSSPPFCVGDDGDVELNQDLKAELNQNDNHDLIEWANENIVDLFG